MGDAAIAPAIARLPLSESGSLERRDSYLRDCCSSVEAGLWFIDNLVLETLRLNSADAAPLTAPPCMRRRFRVIAVSSP